MCDYRLLGNDNVYAYPYDFLESDDITHYYMWKENAPVLKKENRFYFVNPFSGKLEDITSCAGMLREGFISDIPEKTYLTWQTASCSQRQGFAMIRFLGKWYIARRQELSPHTNNYGFMCDHAEECRLEQLVKISKEEKYKDFLFLFSGVDRDISWPPQKTRIWVLHPEGTYNNEMFFMDENSWDIDFDVYSLDCPRKMDECRKLFS